MQWKLGSSHPEVQLNDELKALVPWFSTLKFQDLPTCCFGIPVRLALQGEEPVFFWPGVAHSQKNYVSQLRSCLGTAHFGDYFSDESASLELGLFPCSYLGTDTMSDKQSAMWFPGWYQHPFVVFCSLTLTVLLKDAKVGNPRPEVVDSTVSS